MAQINEYIKGIVMFILTSLMFYYWYDNIFLNLITWAGTDLLSTGLTTSITILYAMAWVSFVIIYITVCPLYLVYAIMIGSKNDVKTEPIELLKGVGVWAVSLPLMTIILGLMYKLIDTLNTATASLMDSGSLTMADNFSWIITLLVIIAVNVYPFICIVKGYGIKLFGDKNDVLEDT